MTDEIRSGRDVLIEFFGGLEKDADLDADTIKTVCSLFEADRLSARNIWNELAENRARETND